MATTRGARTTIGVTPEIRDELRMMRRTYDVSNQRAMLMLFSLWRRVDHQQRVRAFGDVVERQNTRNKP